MLAQLDKVRPVVVLTRAPVRSERRQVTVAPIVSRRRGLHTEVAVGRRNGLDHDSVVTCDDITTVTVDRIGRQIGILLEEQESELRAAIVAAFHLEPGP